MRALLGLLLLVALPGNILASEDLIYVQDTEAIPDNTPLKLSYKDYKPEFKFINYWNSPDDNTVYIPSYRGLRKVAYRVIDRCLARLYREALSNTIEWLDLHRHSEIAPLAMRGSSYYPWWERSMFDSLTIDQGGSRVEYYVVGAQIEIFSLGNVSIYNDGKVQIQGWDVQLSNESERVWQPAAPYVDLETPERLFRLDIDKSYSERKAFWDVSGGVNINIRFRELSSNRSSIKVNLRIACPYLAIRAGINYMPMLGEAVARISVSLLSF